MTLEPVVLDTDVASLSLKGKLPPDVLRLLGGRIPLITFVTLAELTRWVEQRQWGAHRRELLSRWLVGKHVLHSDDHAEWSLFSSRPIRRHERSAASSREMISRSSARISTPRTGGDVAVLSDGAARLVEFGLAGWEKILTTLDQRGPQGLIDEVRRVEETDPCGERWPRYKASDDVTAVHVRF